MKRTIKIIVYVGVILFVLAFFLTRQKGVHGLNEGQPEELLKYSFDQYDVLLSTLKNANADKQYVIASLKPEYFVFGVNLNSLPGNQYSIYLFLYLTTICFSIIIMLKLYSIRSKIMRIL